MACEYRRIIYDGEEAAEITGAPDDIASLSLPEEIEGLKVVSIASRAFSGLRTIREIYIPSSVRSIGAHAFHGSSSLQALAVTDAVEYVGDGAIRFCPNLHRLKASLKTGQCRVVKDLLEGTEQAVRLEASLADGELVLYFPSYASYFDEDTFARAIHPRIQGSGFAYREAVRKSGIDYRSYDACFKRARADGWRSVGEVSLARLRYPRELEETMQSVYEQALVNLAPDFLLALVEERRTEDIAFLAQKGLLRQEAAETALPRASALKLSEICALLMTALGGAAGEESGESAEETFALDDL